MANEKRLIDANAFLKALNERPLDFLDVGGDFGYFDETIDSVVNEQPTVDAAEVVHAKWVHDGRRIHNGVDWWHCSECNKTETGVGIKSNYCPNCGADMRGEEDGK